MFTTLSIKWLPLRFLYFPLSFVLLIVFDRAGYNVSIIKLDFPLPETPDTQQNKPNGTFKFTFFKLLYLRLKTENFELSLILLSLVPQFFFSCKI